MRKKQDNTKLANKRHKKQNKRKVRKIKHTDFLYRTLKKYGKLNLTYGPQPGEKYINAILSEKSAAEKEETIDEKLPG